MNAHPVDIHVGKRLRLKRTMLGLSQEAIGNAIGVSFQQIQKYERGINRMGSSRLYEFGRLMHVPISYFFESFENAGAGAEKVYPLGGMAERKQESFVAEQFSSRESVDLLRNYYRISDPAVRKKVSDLIKSMALQDKHSA